MHCWRRSACLYPPAQSPVSRTWSPSVGLPVGAPKGGMNIFAEYLITSCPFRSWPLHGRGRHLAAVALWRCRTSFRRLNHDDDDDSGGDRVPFLSSLARHLPRVPCSAPPPSTAVIAIINPSLPFIARGFVGVRPSSALPSARVRLSICLSSILSAAYSRGKRRTTERVSG